MEKPHKTTKRVRGTTPELESTAAEMRHRMTPAEKRLWQALKGRQLGGMKWRRQCAVGTFILDFYCPGRKLVVEVDGKIHVQQAEHDAERTRRLNEFGYQVVRCCNHEVRENLPAVLERIEKAITR